MIRNTLPLLCLIAVALAVPLPNNHNQKKQSSSLQRHKRSSWLWGSYNMYRPSQLDTFDKYDLDGDNKLSLYEMFIMFVDQGLPQEDAILFAKQQMRHDINQDGQLNRFEFLRNAGNGMWMWS